jgi:hypothetical protein
LNPLLRRWWWCKSRALYRIATPQHTTRELDLGPHQPQGALVLTGGHSRARDNRGKTGLVVLSCAIRPRCALGWSGRRSDFQIPARGF